MALIKENNILLKPSIKGNKNNIYYEIFSKIDNNTDFFAYYNKPIVYAREKHSVCLNMIYNYEFDNTYLLGDGLFTNKKDLYLTVESKDCMVVIIIGLDFAGVVHISWKNLYLGIIDNIFNLLKKESINIHTLDFIITPSIAIDSMEVKKDFIQLWEDKETYKKYLNNPKILKYDNNKYYFSMFSMFKNILIDKYNINKEAIQQIPIDTYTNKTYSSFRKDGCQTDTNKTVIYIK